MRVQNGRGQVEAFESEQVEVGKVNESVDPDLLRGSRVGEKRLLRHGVRVVVVEACRGVDGWGERDGGQGA